MIAIILAYQVNHALSASAGDYQRRGWDQGLGVGAATALACVTTSPELAAYANTCMVRYTDFNDHESDMIPGCWIRSALSKHHRRRVIVIQ
jgi:2-methylcitrate dehydratase PrpD